MKLLTMKREKKIRPEIIVCVIFYVLLTTIWIISADAYEFPPYEGLQLKITGNISEKYSNNITFSNDERNTEEGFLTMVALGLDLKYEGKRRLFNLSGRADRRIRHKSSDTSNPSEILNMKFRNDFTEYDRIEFYNLFKHTFTPSRDEEFDINECRAELANSGKSLDQIDIECNEFEEEFGRFTGRFDSYENKLHVTYRRTFSDQLTINTNYAYFKDWSDQEGAIDSYQNSAGFRVNYLYTQATNFLLAYDYRIRNYDDRDDINIHAVTAGIRQFITRRLYVDGNVGRQFVSSRNDSISVRAEIVSELTEKTTGRLLYSQGITLSPNREDTFRNWRTNGSLDTFLLEDLRSSITVFYGKGDFVSEDITDTLIGASFRVFYIFWKSKRGSSLKGNLGYSFSDLESTDDSRGYTRNSATAGITLDF